MNQGKTVFAQLMSTISKYEFEKCVERYKGNYKVQSFTFPKNRLIISTVHILGTKKGTNIHMSVPFFINSNSPEKPSQCKRSI